jgi:excisionase family DNA binding protein
MDQLLTIDQCAAHVQVHPSTIRKQIAAGRLPIVKVGRATRISAVSWQAYLDENTHTAAHDGPRPRHRRARGAAAPPSRLTLSL